MEAASADVVVADDGSIRLTDAIRSALNIRSGDTVSLRVDPQQGTLVLTPGIDIRSLFGSVKTSVRGVRVEDMDPGAGPMPYQDQATPDEEW